MLDKFLNPIFSKIVLIYKNIVTFFSFNLSLHEESFPFRLYHELRPTVQVQV